MNRQAYVWSSRFLVSALARIGEPVSTPISQERIKKEFRMSRVTLTAFPFCIVALLLPNLALAAPDGETVFILNTFLFLTQGVMVMLMAAGFCLLEVGLVRGKNATVQSLKNMALYSIAGIMFLLVGYELMYNAVDQWSGWFGNPGLWSPDDPAIQDGAFVAGAGDYARSSDWFFQMVFAATAGSIVSGAVAERVKPWTFLLFVAILTGVIYPLQGSWSWGGGWLAQMGFSDFAGSSVVHSAGGWAALVGAIMVGPRTGRYGRNGPVAFPGSNLPLAALGTFLLWFGWFGFNGGSQLSLGSAADAVAIATIYVNTNLAAAGGVVSVMIALWLLYRRVDLTLVLNGALAGLVAITADPLHPHPLLAVGIGAVGGLLVVFVVPLMDRLRIDDVVGAVPVHLCAGIFGTLIVPLSNPEANLLSQAIGVGAIALFVGSTSFVVWWLLKWLIGIRVDERTEYLGVDVVECGTEAYPEFSRSHQN